MKTQQSDIQSKAIAIRGTPYVQVKDRILYLRRHHSDQYSITTSYTYDKEQKLYIVRAELTIGEQQFTGHAQETESDDKTNVNYSSALENAETSAVGRACAMAGIGIVEALASADEIAKAKKRSAAVSLHPAEPAPTDSRHYGACRACRKVSPVTKLRKQTRFGASYVLNCPCGEKTWLPVGRVKKAIPNEAVAA